MGEKQQVSLEDVARYCGLSTVTVSRVLNHSSSVREYNRQKVMEAIEALGYIPNAAARTLARGTTGIIGMITPGLQDPFFSQIVQEVNQRLDQPQSVSGHFHHRQPGLRLHFTAAARGRHDAAGARHGG